MKNNDDFILIIQQALLDLKNDIILICVNNNVEKYIIDEIIKEIDFIILE